MRHALTAGRTIVLLATLFAAWVTAADEPKTPGAKIPGVSKTPEAASGNLVTGIVLDPAGAPAAGCRVWALDLRLPDDLTASVIDQAKSDSQGRFRLPKGDWTTWFARDAKGRVGWPISPPQRRLPRNTEPVPIQLIAVRDYRSRLVDTSGQPIAKARIRPIWLAQKTQGQLLFAYDSVDLPPEFAKEMAGESGADGVFVLRGAPAEGAVRAEVSAPGFGSFHATCALSTPTTIRLAPPGSVGGSLICKADPNAAAGVKLQLNCHGKAPSPWDDYYVVPHAETLTQKDGSFLFAEVPPGEYWLRATWGANVPYCLDLDDPVGAKPIHVKSREVTSVGSMTLRPTVPVHGTVVDAKSGAGIPDVELDLSYPAGLTRTDARGAYSARVAPGTLRIYLKDVPDAYVQPQSDARRLETEAAKEATVPAIRLQPTRAVEGIVVDESGKPVPGAEVVPHAGIFDRMNRPRSDQNGKFVVKGVPDDASVQLRARTETAVTDGVVMAHPGDGPMRLVVSRKNTFRLRGSVVDETGQPVPAAAVTLYTNWTHNGRHTILPVDEQQTDAQGSFAFALWPGEDYHVSMTEGEGYETAYGSSSPATEIRGKPGQTREVPRIVLTSLRGTVEGTVVDSAGKPLAGVRVFNNGDAREMILVRTDAAGRFRLQGLEPGPVYVFATQPDCRFTGLRTTSGATGLVVKLLRKDEPVPPWPRAKPPSYQEQQAVARRCLMKLWALGDQPRSKEAMILAMGRIDMEQAQKWCSASGGIGRATLQRLHIDKVAEKDPDEAIKLAGQFAGDYAGPCDVLWSLGKRYAASEPAKAIRFAEKMAPLARELEPSARARQLARAGGLAISSGNKDAGGKWIEEAAALVPSLRNAKDYDFVLKEIAEAMASYDARRALKLLEQTDPRWREACMGDVAVAGCLVDLEHSFKIIGAMTPDEHSLPRNVDRARLRIACRLAATNPERAVKLVEEIPNDYGVGARAYARLAVAMAPHHKALAWSLMDRAMATGQGMAHRPGMRIGGGPRSEAAEFAVWAGEIGYPDMESAICRVLACRPAGRERFPDDGREEMVDMAAKLALVHPETAQEILRSIERRIDLAGTQLTPWNGGGLWLSAWALADLKHAEELFDRALAEPKETKGLLGQGLGWSGLPKMAEVLAVPPSLRLHCINRLGPLSYEFLGGLEEKDD